MRGDAGTYSISPVQNLSALVAEYDLCLTAQRYTVFKKMIVKQYGQLGVEGNQDEAK